MRPPAEKRFRFRDANLLQDRHDLLLRIPAQPGLPSCVHCLPELPADAHGRVQGRRGILEHHRDGPGPNTAECGLPERVDVLSVHQYPSSREPAASRQVAQHRMGNG